MILKNKTVFFVFMFLSLLIMKPVKVFSFYYIGSQQISSIRPSPNQETPQYGPPGPDAAAELERRKNEIRNKTNGFESEKNSEKEAVNGIKTGKDSSDSADAKNAEIENSAAVSQAENQSQAANVENRNKTDQEKDKANAQSCGDPVKISNGTYEQSEIDIVIGAGSDYEIKRIYNSGNPVTGSFGYGWTTNLDERIILGTGSGLQEVVNALETYIKKLNGIISDLEKALAKAYEVSSIYNAKSEINSRILSCESHITNLNYLIYNIYFHAVDISGYSDLFYDAAVVLVDADSVRSSAESKKSTLQSRYNRIDYELDTLSYLCVRRSEMQAKLEQKKALLAKEKQIKERNKKVMFPGMKNFYQEVGFESISVIDAEGYPHILDEENDVYKNASEKQYERCEKNGNAFILYESDGTVKKFDDAGFIVKITDRNGNAINIIRNSDEKIRYIETSFGEQYDFEYTGNYISKITNVRSQEENVIYSYSGNKLISVKDTDGDTVTMNYDEDGRMISLNKCDGSTVTFTYGEQDSEENVYTTSTTNEEGYSEYFEYHRSEKSAVYTDHDGNKVTYNYDDKNRTIRELRADGSDIKKDYDSDGNLICLNQNGNITRFTYDSKGNKTGSSYSDGSRETWTYDSFNQITSYTNRDGVKEEYIRDNKKNLIEYRKGGKTAYSQEYNSKGLVIRKTVYSNNPVITDYEYDAYGNKKTESCGGVKTEYEYDSQNRVTNIKIAGKTLRQYEYNGRKIICSDYNGLETTYITNGRKDLTEVIQKDTVTGIIHKTRIEYDRRHLPLRVYLGDGEIEKLINSYTYTPEGKLRAEILHGREIWIKLYEYKNNQISEIKQFKTSPVVEPVETTNNEIKLQNLINSAGENVFIQKYNFTIQNGNRKLVTVTDALGVQSFFEYDSYGNLVKTTDGNGEVRQNAYTRGGLLSKEQTSYGGWYEYGYKDGMISSAKEENGTPVKIDYYADGSIKTQTDRYGKVTYYYYNERGLLSSVQSEVRKIWYEYDSFDRIIKQTVGNSPDEYSASYFVTYDYSQDGRRVTVTEGGKYRTVNKLDVFGNITKQIDGNNNERSYVYDAQNNLVEIYNGYNNRTSYEYNSLGQVSRVILPDGATTNYEYNYMSFLTKVTDDCGTVYTASYDKTGRLIKEKTRSDSEKSSEYDRTGRITKILCGGEVVESYTYGANGRTVTVKDGNGNDYLYNYDAFGRLIKERNRNNLEQNYYYDTNGQLKSKSDFLGGTTTITYSSNRIIKIVTYSDGSENRLVYDALGNIIEAQNAYGKTFYRYDQGNRLVYQKDVTTGEEVYFDYDEAGNRILLESSNRQTTYTYGKNNEVKEIFDNKQRISIKLKYDKNGREILKQFGNGTSEHTHYDKAGRVTVKMQKSDRGELLWGEGYVYGSDGKRTSTVDNAGRVTLYEYDNQGRLSTIYYPYSDELKNNLSKEAEENGLSSTEDCAENKYLSSETRSLVIPLLNAMQYGLSYKLSNLHVFIKESYLYDRNGNRKTKASPFGTIEYTYDKENCLVSTGSKGQAFVNYSYDAMGNLLTEESSDKTVKYAYNAQNRLIYCEITDRKNKEYAKTSYAYDAFGRRVIVQDSGEAALRTLYDGLTFDIIKQSPTLTNGMFIDYYETGIRWGNNGRPTGDRYRYLADDETKDKNRYFYLDENTYKTVNTRYRGERTNINVNGTLAAQSTTEGTDYFSTDLLGSIRNTTDSYGITKLTTTYDAFGSLVEGNLIGTTDYGYLGKQNDPATKLYNYGFRDYKPKTARFTTIDPLRDGHNWFSYCNSDPVNFIDFLGLELTFIVDKDSQMMTVEINTPNYTKRIDIPITTHVISDYNDVIEDKNANSDNTRKQKTGKKETNPTQFPNGTASITSADAVSSKYNGKYGDGWLTTNATQSLPATDGSGNVIDDGYFIHFTGNTNTNGCIGIKNLSDMERILEFYDINKSFGDGKATIKVNGGKKNK